MFSLTSAFSVISWQVQGLQYACSARSGKKCDVRFFLSEISKASWKKFCSPTSIDRDV